MTLYFSCRNHAFTIVLPLPPPLSRPRRRNFFRALRNEQHMTNQSFQSPHWNMPLSDDIITFSFSTFNLGKSYCHFEGVFFFCSLTITSCFVFSACYKSLWLPYRQKSQRTAVSHVYVLEYCPSYINGFFFIAGEARVDIFALASLLPPEDGICVTSQVSWNRTEDQDYFIKKRRVCLVSTLTIYEYRIIIPSDSDNFSSCYNQQVNEW